MIVEDDRDFAESLLNILEMEDYFVIVAHDADDAKKMLVSKNPSICLVDIHLGKQNGIDLIADLKEISPDLICVVVTAFAEIDSALKAIKINVYDYLRKPLFAPELFATLSRCFEKIGLEEQKRDAVSALAESAEIYRRLFEEDITGDFIAYRDGSITLCNPPFVKIFSYDSVSAAQNSNIKTHFLNEHDWEQFLEKLKKEKRLIGFESVLYKHDRSVVHIIANVIGKFNERGDLEKMTGYLMDITNHKILEKLYFQAQKMEAIGRFAGGIAHDFNNLLTIILNYSISIKENIGMESIIGKEIDEVVRATMQASTLTRQLLMFSRKEQAKPKIVNLNDIILEMKNMLKRLIGEDIRLVTELDDSLHSIMADPIQISQIVMNLSANSRDAMPDGGTLIIKTRNRMIDDEEAEQSQELYPGEFVELEVSDTGVGMNEITKEHVFEPFFSTKDPGKGTGLGLSTVFGIVKQSSGLVTIETELNQGVKFHILFPKTDKKAEADIIPKSAGTPIHTNATILVVEDNNSIKLLLKNILKNEGYTVLMASNGKNALEVCRRTGGNIQLVITDLMMPEMGGEELVAHLLPEYPDIKVLFMSGYVENILDKKESNHKKGVDFILKPFTNDELINRIRVLLALR
ncbi:MAG: response regulator [Spirochaetales bacterium]|nr:response regulator [Spirochaetales bacterium]